MDSKENVSFEHLLETIINDELSILVRTLSEHKHNLTKNYLTIKEVSSMTGIGTSVIRQLTLSRAMPHRKVKSRIILDENEIKETIADYKKLGWTDPENNWDVKTVQSEIANFHKKKEEPIMIDEILRKIIREELAVFPMRLRPLQKKTRKDTTGELF